MHIIAEVHILQVKSVFLLLTFFEFNLLQNLGTLQSSFMMQLKVFCLSVQCVQQKVVKCKIFTPAKWAIDKTSIGKNGQGNGNDERIGKFVGKFIVEFVEFA